MTNYLVAQLQNVGKVRGLWYQMFHRPSIGMVSGRIRYE
jgi:hypothetical protein